MRFEVTADQAAAFVEALTGMEEINQSEDPCGGYNSPAAVIHLQAVLGLGNLPTVSSVYQAAGDLKNNARTQDARRRLESFCDYLESVTSALRFRMGGNPAGQAKAEENSAAALKE